MNGGKVGSTCPKKYLALNNEFNDKGMCTASRAYLNLKIKELKLGNLSKERYDKAVSKLTEKSCICVGLGTSALMVNDLDTKVEGDGVSVCPGPNMAYFSKITSLKEMVDHIYGRSNIITRTDRPNMFVKELGIYIDFLKNKIEETKDSFPKAFGTKQEKHLVTFAQNLKEGINYYNSLFGDLKDKFEETKSCILSDLDAGKKTLHLLSLEIEKISLRNKRLLLQTCTG